MSGQADVMPTNGPQVLTNLSPGDNTKLREGSRGGSSLKHTPVDTLLDSNFQHIYPLDCLPAL